MTETQIAALLCAWLAGAETEERHAFVNLGDDRAIRVDCETPTHVIEVGLDKGSSRDSLHQALFAAELTGKVPMVVLIDRDGVEGRYEQEMRIVAVRAGVPYARCTEDFIVRWDRTRAYRGAAAGDDLPKGQGAWGTCDIATVYRDSAPLVDPEKARALGALPPGQ